MQYDTRRVDLNDTESKLLSEWFYKTGFGGRDALYKQIQEHYSDNDTPQKERISRRQMWHWLEKQEVFIEFITNTLLCKVRDDWGHSQGSQRLQREEASSDARGAPEQGKVQHQAHPPLHAETGRRRVQQPPRRI
jgi:hypothetical protein